MAFAPALLNFPADGSDAFYRGDTIDPIRVTVTINATPATMAAVAIDLRYNGTRRHRYDSADGSIIIAPGLFTIPEHKLDIPGFDYDYDCQVTLDTGEVVTYFAGLWKVREDITRAI